MSHHDEPEQKVSPHASSSSPLSFSTSCSRHYAIHPSSISSVGTPICATSTYQLKSVAHGALLSMRDDIPFADEAGFVYTRWSNPTVQVAAKIIANLEGAEAGTLLLGSGMAAISNTMMTTLAYGDHVVMQRAVYGGCYEFLTIYMSKMGVTYDFVDGNDNEAWKKAIKPNTRMLYAETPCNPLVRLTDIEYLGALANETFDTRCKGGANPALSKCYVVIDATFGTPYHHQLLKVPGVFAVLHSATKYMGGHSDITAGCVSSNNKEFITKLGKTLKLVGGILSPFEAMLLARGLKTLDVRMSRHNENAMKIATYLSTHSSIDVVHYPGLPSHPDHALAKKQMKNGFGGMIAFEVKGGLEAGKAVVENLGLITLAVSLGSVESLMCHPASMTHIMLPKKDRESAGIKDGLVRFSVGIENADDLIADLGNALAKAKDALEGRGLRME